MRMILAFVTLATSLTYSLNSEALEARCDQDSFISRGPYGVKYLLLPGGGDSSYTGYRWEALTEYPDGRIDYPRFVTIERVDEKSLVLRSASQRWRDNGKLVTCFVEL